MKKIRIGFHGEGDAYIERTVPLLVLDWLNGIAEELANDPAPYAPIMNIEIIGEENE